MEMQEKFSETRKENTYYARIQSKRIEAARTFRSLDKETEAYTKYIQGVKLAPKSLKALGRI